MRRKKLILSALVIMFSCFCILLCGFGFFNKNKSNVENTSQKIEKNSPDIQNNLWCITFQLIWNDFTDKYNHGQPIEFEGGNPPIADKLNLREYSKNDLSENSYYIVNKELSPKLKKEIEKTIKKKFNEKSDILDFIDWNAKDSYLFYSMLKKDFEFLTRFDNLAKANFNKSKENVKYFGIDKKSKANVRKNVTVLFYENSDEFAVKLTTKEKEDVILYRTTSGEDFEELFETLNSKILAENFGENDYLKIPNIKINKTISYDELCGKKLKNSNHMITQALQSVKFNLDSKGGSLKSEAAMSVMRMSLAPVKQSRYFNFDKPFVLFLKEENKTNPYFAVRINDLTFLESEGN